MANIPFGTLPGTIDIPNDLPTFKTKSQAVWTGSNWRTKGSFTPTHGDRTTWSHTLNRSVSRQDSMYLPQDTTGLKITTNTASVNTSNYESYGDGRWMPASCFNGLGFEVWQDGGGVSNIYLRKYGLVFISKSGGTGGSYRTWGVDTGVSAPSRGYRYLRVTSSSATVSDIRNWGPSWMFQGLVLHFANASGGSGSSTIDVYNLKVGHKFSTTGGQYRYIPAAYRAYTNRDKSTGLVGFTNPYEPK